MNGLQWGYEHKWMSALTSCLQWILLMCIHSHICTVWIQLDFGWKASLNVWLLSCLGPLLQSDVASFGEVLVHNNFHERNITILKLVWLWNIKLCLNGCHSFFFLNIYVSALNTGLQFILAIKYSIPHRLYYSLSEISKFLLKVFFSIFTSHLCFFFFQQHFKRKNPFVIRFMC